MPGSPQHCCAQKQMDSACSAHPRNASTTPSHMRRSDSIHIFEGTMQLHNAAHVRPFFPCPLNHSLWAVQAPALTQLCFQSPQPPPLFAHLWYFHHCRRRVEVVLHQVISQQWPHLQGVEGLQLQQAAQKHLQISQSGDISAAQVAMQQRQGSVRWT